MTPCPPIVHYAHRIIRRVIRRHAHHAIGVALAAGCVAPVGMVFLLPPTVAAAPDTRPVAVPEPAGWGVLVVGVMGLVGLRLSGSRRAASGRSQCIERGCASPPSPSAPTAF